ncbi:HAD family phosphatase [Streptomyces beijiangensis]|uniref:HAD family phosphatase n=1 Tax=Streptomyces beijiangensis TaxID=163361 RepID=UPI001F5C1733|nr:HAD family phosphatase [Streptomyces beijiangensis]
MTPLLSTLRLAAVNIDGVLLNDTFTPVIHSMIVAHGRAYTLDLEREILSQPRKAAARILGAAIGSTASEQELLQDYFARRELYLREHPVRLLDGAVALLRTLRGAGLEVICYGGLDRSHFDEHLGAASSFFTEPGYVCTNGFRPGVQEIVRDRFGLGYEEAVFIDDVAKVAEKARELDVPFIGHPSDFAHSFQRTLMREAGVRHLVRSLYDVDEALLRTIDAEAARGACWRDADEPAPVTALVPELVPALGAVRPEVSCDA